MPTLNFSLPKDKLMFARDVPVGHIAISQVGQPIILRTDTGYITLRKKSNHIGHCRTGNILSLWDWFIDLGPLELEIN